MGNSLRPGTVVVREIEHEALDVLGVCYRVRELVWNGMTERSYDVVRVPDDAVLTEEESFDSYPTDAQILGVLGLT